METTLKYDGVILIKEMGEKFKQVGKLFEIAGILDNVFLLRDAETKVAVGVVKFEDLEKHFIHKEDFKGWTKWTSLVGFNGQSDARYRSNGRRVQVEFLTSKVRGESCCHKEDDFDIAFGIKMAYLRACNKAIKKQLTEYKEKINEINHEIGENETILESMIDSLKD